MMGAFAGLFASMFSGLVGLMVFKTTLRTAQIVAAVALFAGLTIALMATISALIVGVVTYVPLPPALVLGFFYFMPSNFPACVGALIAADTASAIYQWNVKNLNMATKWSPV